ncbi:hypothetical protein Mapa_010500 [Marchantia paleacea]|nr:hypothetical protein Mapa_010500 [Marchantia paleacea]
MAENSWDEPDRHLWSQLPEGVLLRILAFLPLESVMQCRRVCRKWQAMFQWPAFYKIRQPEKSWFVFSYLGSLFLPNMAHMQALCYNPSLNRWNSMSFSFLPGNTGIVAAAAGGLLLCVGIDKESEIISMQPHSTSRVSISKVPWNWKDLFVYNPMKAGSWKKLPERRISPGGSSPSPITIMGLIDVHTSVGLYKVVVATHHGTEIFDSRESTWRFVDCRPPDEPKISHVNTWTISYKGCLVTAEIQRGEPYRMADGHLRVVGHAGYLWLFNPAAELWSSVRLPDEFVDEYIHHLQIEECEGRLLLVGILGPWKDVPQNGRVHVWEHIGDGDVFSRNGFWKELCSRSVQELRDSCIRVGSEDCARFIAAATSSDLLCFAMNRKSLRVPTLGIIDSKSVVLLIMFMYSVSQNTWCLVEERLGKFVSFLDDRSKDRYIGSPAAKSLRFQPRLDAAVTYTSL